MLNFKYCGLVFAKTKVTKLPQTSWIPFMLKEIALAFSFFIYNPFPNLKRVYKDEDLIIFLS